MQKLAFLGLGVMGAPMAGHLSNAGYSVSVFNRSPNKAAVWLEQYSGHACLSPYLAAQACDVVISCVGDDDSVRSLTLGDGDAQQGAFQSMGSGSVFIDHTTTSADLARELYEIATQKGIAYIDAPVSGGQLGAENGQLTIMVGGDESVYNRIRPIIENYAKALTYMGASGAGQLTKMVNQICISGLVQALSEGVAFSEKAGLDTQRVLEVISKGAAQSWQMENRGQSMVEGRFDYGFAVDHMRKDLGICLNEARNNGASLPITAAVDQLYSQVQTNGGHRWDTSSLVTLLNRYK